MSLNAIHRKVMIFSDTQQKAEEKLNELAQEYDILRRTKDRIETVDGEIIQAKRFYEGCRGYRYQKVYVDYSLAFDGETMTCITMKLVPPSYYDMSKFGEEWNWRDHVFYF